MTFLNFPRLGGLFLAALAPASASVTVVDHFTRPIGDTTACDVVASGTVACPAYNAGFFAGGDPVGGYRTGTGQASGPVGTSQRMQVQNITSGADYFSFVTATQVYGFYSLRYDANGAGLGLNFSDYSAFEFDYIAPAVPSAARIIIDIYTSGGLITASIANLAPQFGTFAKRTVGWGEFTGTGSGTINRIDFTIWANTASAAGFDIDVDQLDLREVPEPATAALLGMGLVVAGLLRRRS